VSSPSLILFRLIQIACHGDTPRNMALDDRSTACQLSGQDMSTRDPCDGISSFFFCSDGNVLPECRNLRLEEVSIRIRARAFRQRRAGTAHPIRAILVHLWVLVRLFCLSSRASPAPNKNSVDKKYANALRRGSAIMRSSDPEQTHDHADADYTANQ
jgi:hypothetical protein